jgi:glyoxylase-like metal-dependent hydrolase (beta-lactamase superfamily II)
VVAKITFFPVGNGDTSQIVLGNDRWLLFDFHHQTMSEEEGSTDFNLKKHLKDQLKAAKRDYYDVLALTHGDNDHISNSTEFFELSHAARSRRLGKGRCGCIAAFDRCSRARPLRAPGDGQRSGDLLHGRRVSGDRRPGRSAFRDRFDRAEPAARL